MNSKRSLANKIHYETLAEAWSSGRELPPEIGEWSVLTAEPGGVDYVETNLGDKTALWVQPKQAAKDRVMLYLHGGGYVGGSIWTHRKMVGHLAKAIGCNALLATYDYSFQSKFPRQIEQAATAFEWLAEQGIEPKHTIGAGDSAGAGLIVAAAMKLRDAGRPLPVALLSISGWHDLSASGRSYEANREKDAFFQKASVDMLASQVLGGADPRHPFASPIFADLKGLPPIYLQVGEDETLLDDSRALADRAKAAGVEVRLEVFPGMLHSFQMMAGRAPEADDAIERFAQWVRPKLGLIAAAQTRGESQQVA
jgi:acetyl esterase/lipase